MKPNEDQFDDFKTPETASYVNEVIGRVFEKELTEVEQFKEDLDDHFNWLYRFFEQSYNVKVLGKIHVAKSEQYKVA